jgi:hypothetical protein
MWRGIVYFRRLVFIGGNYDGYGYVGWIRRGG